MRVQFGLNVVTFGKVFKLMHVTVVALYSIYLIAIGECESIISFSFSHPLCFDLCKTIPNINGIMACVMGVYMHACMNGRWLKC